jgi:DNA-binding NtrC family response regulator
MPNICRELNGKRILLVEGEPWTRNSLSLVLRVEGCCLQVAASTAEAMAALSAGRFDLIICEYWLPDMDGLSFLKLFGDCHPGTVKILTSSYMSDQAMGEAKWAGVHDVIRPPFTGEILGRAISRNRAPLAVQGNFGADRKGNVGDEKEWTRRMSHDEQKPRPIGQHQTSSYLGGTGTEEGRYCSRVLESALRPN